MTAPTGQADQLRIATTRPKVKPEPTLARSRHEVFGIGAAEAGCQFLKSSSLMLAGGLSHHIRRFQVLRLSLFFPSTC